ncbi:glycosyltransferase [Striga asiatica]|uniref:Glycosyltransferase n=1 Tax=Striga asiatica TaxID=4170 RepID=A0A5A7QYJ6_STRAF|nr:glycosyltransferase [Striga asiatica]
MEIQKQPKFKILMFPYLAHGHISPFLQLAKTLPTTNFTIYLCSTLINLNSIRANSETPSSIKLVELHVPPTPELPSELHTTKNLPSNLIRALLKAFQASSPSFIEILNSIKPDLLIYDFFQPWAPKLASLNGIPSVYFSTSGSTVFAYAHHVHSMGTGSTFPFKTIHIPDFVEHKIWKEIKVLVKDADDDFSFGNLARSHDIVLVRSCRALEQKYMDYLSVLCKKRIVPTGPLITDIPEACDHNNYNIKDQKHSNIMKWLSEKGPSSTIYISFGSEYFLSETEIAEIAKGLQICRANFLWVIRLPHSEKIADVEEKLPEGFLEAVKDRGMVTGKWAPQTRILAHPSVGGFVSHCGWSSITESMYFGVPIIGMPMKAEQPANARLAVDVGTGIEVPKGKGRNYAGEELANAIDKVMKEDEFRVRAKRMSEKIKENAEREANETAEELLRICMENKKQM